MEAGGSLSTVLFLTFYLLLTEKASLPPTALLCAGGCNIGRHALRLSAPLAVREAGGWGGKAARTLASMPVKVLASSLDFAGTNLFIRNKANDPGQVKTGAGCKQRASP